MYKDERGLTCGLSDIAQQKEFRSNAFLFGT